MRLDQVLAYLDGRLPAAERPAVETYLVSPAGRQTKEILALLREAARRGGPAEREPCDRLEEVCALAEGSLSSVERVAAEAHLLECAGCFRSFLELNEPLAHPELGAPPEVLARAKMQGSGAGGQGSEAGVPLISGKILPIAGIQGSPPGQSHRSPTPPRLWRGGLVGLTAASLLLFVLWRPTLQSQFQLPSGPGAPSTSGKPVTTSIATDKGAAAEGGFQDGTASATPVRRINILLQDLQQNPGDLAARQQLAMLYEQLGRRELAIKHYHLLQEELVRRALTGSKNYSDIQKRLNTLEGQ